MSIDVGCPIKPPVWGLDDWGGRKVSFLKRLRASGDFAEVGWRVPLSAVGVPQNARRDFRFLLRS